MLQKTCSPRLGEAQQGLQQKSDEPGPDEALLPLPLVQVGEPKWPCARPQRRGSPLKEACGRVCLARGAPAHAAIWPVAI